MRVGPALVTERELPGMQGRMLLAFLALEGRAVRRDELVAAL